LTLSTLKELQTADPNARRCGARNSGAGKTVEVTFEVAMETDFLRAWQVDWKRVGEYLLGRSTLIGIASLMLLFISGYATWHGMRDFIVSVSGSSLPFARPLGPTAA
jgi:hypothetical protein